ncbi:MAG: MXAN_2562 family outer membrane beta-barrel protein [Myxococcales bacterium]
MRDAWALALAVPLALAAPALSQEGDDGYTAPVTEESIRAHDWTVELRFSTVFYPDADSGAPNLQFINPSGTTSAGPPFQDVYGSKHRLLSDLEMDRDLWQGFGSVSVGLGVGYSEFYGHGMVQAACPSGAGLCFNRSSVASSFHLVPIRLLATYRFDYFVPRHFPLVPFVRVGLDWVIYWNAESSGQISYEPSGASENAIGLVTGVEGSAGLMLLLDDIDGQISRDALHDIGISHTYLMAEWVDQIIQNGPSNLVYDLRTFGKSSPPAALDLSASYFDFGVAVQF